MKVRTINLIHDKKHHTVCWILPYFYFFFVIWYDNFLNQLTFLWGQINNYKCHPEVHIRELNFCFKCHRSGSPWKERGLMKVIVYKSCSELFTSNRIWNFGCFGAGRKVKLSLSMKVLSILITLLPHFLVNFLVIFI